MMFQMSPQSWAGQLLTVPDQEELLSIAYVHAVAARAGYVTAVYERDRHGIDMRIQAGGDMRPALDLQMKATINLRHLNDGNVSFPLPRRNYDLLREAAQTPSLLVVLELPTERANWMTITEDELVMRRRAYWLSLLGCPESTNRTTVTVRIPKANTFDVEGLQALMEQSRTGRIQ